jgi:hypothetical protein
LPNKIILPGVRYAQGQAMRLLAGNKKDMVIEEFGDYWQEHPSQKYDSGLIAHNPGKYY